MWVLRVRERGRDLAAHRLDSVEEARELRQVYAVLGYPAERIVIERADRDEQRAA